MSRIRQIEEKHIKSKDAIELGLELIIYTKCWIIPYTVLWRLLNSTGVIPHIP